MRKLLVHWKNNLMSLRVHCFNNYENQKICPDLEVSYLIECKLPLEQNPIRVQRRNQQNKLSCAINNTYATVPTIMNSTSPTMLSSTVPTLLNSTSLTSNGRATSIKFIYLMIIYLRLLIWNKYAKLHFCTEIQLFSKKTWLPPIIGALYTCVRILEFRMERNFL